MKKLVVGRIGKAYGVFGWVKLQSYTDPAKNILDYSPLYFKKSDQWQILTIEASKFHDQQLLVKFKEFNDPETARMYANIELSVDRDQLPELKTEVYWIDLIGCTVKNREGDTLGVVKNLLETGSNDILVVESEEKRHLIPYLDNIIDKVDLPKKSITVDWDKEF